MRLIVQKFGGTSLATMERRLQVVDKIVKAKDMGYGCIVVVSAIGRKGDPYATDTLIDFVKNNGCPNISPRELDLLLNCGEIISAVTLSQLLKREGYESIVFNGAQAGILTDNIYNNARILNINSKKILDSLKENRIVIVAGFQGITQDGEYTTLGRGGSDTTAAALGAAVGAEVVEIFTDVDGIKTADPSIVEDAKTLDQVTYYEICNLAQQGARVIHPRAVEIAMQYNIPLRIRSTFSTSPGTLITNNGNKKKTVEFVGEDLITAIAHVADITQLSIKLENMQSAQEIKLEVFKKMASYNISIDFINVSPVNIIFTVHDNEAEKAIELLKKLNLNFEVLTGCAKISTIGANMAGVPGVMASIVEALTEEGIEILQTADSHTTIWCLVSRDNMEKAVCALHKKFKLN